MKRVVFVCTGNTCRSPMAEHLFRELLRQRGVEDVEVSSAGLAASAGFLPADNAVDALSEVGLDLSPHRSAPFAKEQAEADLIVTMTAGMRDMLQALYPDRADHIVTLLPGGSLEDPYGQSLEVYRRCRDTILRALPRILELISHG